MTVSDIVIILIFILPGVLAEKISHALDMPKDTKRTEFGELINGILLSFPIVFISALITHLYKKCQYFNDYIKATEYPLFLFKFAGLVLCISILAGLIFGSFKDYIYIPLNFIRKKIFKRIEKDDKSSWRKLFLDRGGCKFVEVEMDGEIIHKGFVAYCSLPGEEKELVFSDQDLADKYADKFKNVNYTYINLEKNIVIRDYDTTEYVEYCNKNNKRACKKDT